MTKKSEAQRGAALKQELKKLLLETGDPRFGPAIEALIDHFPAAPRRGPKREWNEFELMILWVYVQATMRAFSLSISSACANLAKSPIGWMGGRRLSKSRIEARYHEAVKYLANDQESRTEAESDVPAMTRIFSERRSRTVAKPINRRTAS